MRTSRSVRKNACNKRFIINPTLTPKISACLSGNRGTKDRVRDRLKESVNATHGSIIDRVHEVDRRGNRPVFRPAQEEFMQLVSREQSIG